jgi:hypothetical protein
MVLMLDSQSSFKSAALAVGHQPVYNPALRDRPTRLRQGFAGLSSAGPPEL